ncbi:MAG: ABC transporter ATP-binding protein, partial [Planctomycetota bacterium]
GKTTTISCLVGLLRPQSGSMSLGDQPFQPQDRPGDRARLGWVPQELALYEPLSALENLRFFASMAGLTRSTIGEAVDQALELAGLTDRAADRVATFSGGMKRRLNLAIATLHQPDLLLLDEPTTGVDPQSRNHLFETLIRLKSAGMTMLYTTHYMEEAQRLCDRITIMNQGKVIRQGTSQALADQIGDPEANLETVFLHHTGVSLRD